MSFLTGQCCTVYCCQALLSILEGGRYCSEFGNSGYTFFKKVLAGQPSQAEVS